MVIVVVVVALGFKKCRRGITVMEGEREEEE
jgi:hypothetical protein